MTEQPTPPFTDADLAEAQRLIREGFKQTSGRRRILSRVPRGMTPLEALQEADKPRAQELKDALRDAAESEMMRVYAKREDQVILTPAVWRAFRAAGGQASG